MDMPLTEEELARFESLASERPEEWGVWTENCHSLADATERLVAEVRRLRTQLAKHHTAGYVSGILTDTSGTVHNVEYKPGCRLGCDE